VIEYGCSLSFKWLSAVETDVYGLLGEISSSFLRNLIKREKEYAEGTV
jgi:hypothetical protein